VAFAEDDDCTGMTMLWGLIVAVELRIDAAAAPKKS